MLNPRLAGRYAKSLLDLAKERNQVEAVYDDMRYLQGVCKQSPEFVQMIKSPVISIERKGKILEALLKEKITGVTYLFTQLLVSKNREFYLPEIVEAFVDQYNALNGIHKVKLTTAVPVSDAVKKSLVERLIRETEIEHIELESKVREELIGGFILEFDNNLVDASIARDLRDVKTQFDKNFYLQQIR